MEIKEYEEKYAKGMSEIILSNLYTITIKDHGQEVVDRIAKHFTEEEIKKNFPYRIKCFVAVDEDKVLIPASVYGLEFYRKLGYDFYNGNSSQNEDGEYILSKYFNKKTKNL